jgi:hypothetical protein
VTCSSRSTDTNSTGNFYCTSYLPPAPCRLPLSSPLLSSPLLSSLLLLTAYACSFGKTYRRRTAQSSVYRERLTIFDLAERIEIGKTITLTVWRDGKEQSLSAVFAHRPEHEYDVRKIVEPVLIPPTSSLHRHPSPHSVLVCAVCRCVKK